MWVLLTFASSNYFVKLTQIEFHILSKMLMLLFQVLLIILFTNLILHTHQET